MPAGIVMVWSGDRPAWQVFEAPRVDNWDKALVLGRALTPHDDRVSTKHFGLYPRDNDILLEDFRSRNGTYVNGDKVGMQKTMRDRSVIRTGRTVWIAMFDIAPVRDGTWTGFEDDAVRMDELPVVLVDLVRRIAPDMAIHATVIEQCLLAKWRDREQFVATITAATERRHAHAKDKLRGEHLGDLELRVRSLPFADVFEKWMGGPPPFPIPASYEVLQRQDIALHPYEVIIGSPGSRPLLVQAEVGAVGAMPVGWFMAGFWGHGVNSYAVYYGRRTSKYSVFLRLPYGEGVYESNPEQARQHAYERIERTQQIVDTLDVEFVELVQAMGGGHYRIVCRDGRVLTSPQQDFYDWNDVDFEALVRGG